MSAERAEIPPSIVSYLKRGNESKNSGKDISPNIFSVTDICRCLRQSFYRLSGTPVDTDDEQKVEDLWSIQSGKFLHNLTYSYRWRELDVEVDFPCSDIAETLQIHGRLDMYDYKTQTIIDLKTTSFADWQYRKGLIPRAMDVSQIQCYGSLFGQVVKVSNLVLLYADLKNMFAFRVPVVDMTEWMRTRVGQLYVSTLVTRSPPPAEVSYLCNFCQYKNRCELSSGNLTGDPADQ